MSNPYWFERKRSGDYSRLSLAPVGRIRRSR